MKYQVSQNNIHIEDSAFISKRDFGIVLKNIHDQSEDDGNHSLVWKRTWESLEYEWALHNFCYALGLWRSHTKDVDLNYPQKWWETLAYNILGAVAMIFIK